MPLYSATALYGDGGTGKSLLAMQLMTCAASGQRFLGMITKPMAALGLFCEDDADELHRRQDAINAHYGITYSDLPDLHYMARAGMDNALVEYQDKKLVPSQLYREILQHSLDLGVQLIVIDTAADTFIGNENNRQEVRQYVQILNQMARDINGALILCAHPSVYGITSGTGGGGSTAWSNAVRQRIYLERDKAGEDHNSNVRILSRKKANYAATGDEIRLVWEKDVFKVEAGESDIATRIRKNACANACIDTMRKLAAQNINLSAIRNSANYATKIIAQKLHKQYSIAEIDKAISHLLDRGKIANALYGRPSRQSYRLEIVENLELDLEDE